MTLNEALKKLEEYERISFALNHASGLMYYDGATVAPRGSADIRANTLGELSRMSYDLTTGKETEEMILTLNDNIKSLDNVTARKVSELYRDYDRLRRVPADEYVAWQMLAAKADSVWHDAKANNDFASFEPVLQEMFDTFAKIVNYFSPEKDTYDAMLDCYERGLTSKDCDTFFASLRKDIVPLINEVTHSKQIDDSPLRKNFSVPVQREFSDFVMSVMGIDKNRCIIGETEHPFTTNFSKYDVRITTHYHEDMLVSSLYSVIHEGGHALYELNIADNITFSNLGTGVSMAIHESQSRFYENIIGRSREFCAILLPWLKVGFSTLLDGVTDEDFYRMVNKSEPSLIRTEADELTYPLHIMVRYELERRMVSGEMKAHDLPHEWNRLYKEYLGITVPSDREGVLQDSHWSNGNIGYFPSYAIGSAYGAQYLREMGKTFDVFGSLKSGNTEQINGWFREKIWKHGCMFDPDKLFASVCGKFDPSVYTEYLKEKFSDIYSLR